MKRKQQILAGSLVLAVFAVGAVALASGSLSFGSSSAATASNGTPDASSQSRAVLSEAQKQADGRSGTGLIERLTQPGSTTTAQSAPPTTGTPAQPTAPVQPVQVTQTTDPVPTVTPGAGPAPTATPGAGPSQTPTAFVPTSGKMPALTKVSANGRQLVLRSVASHDMCR